MKNRAFLLRKPDYERAVRSTISVPRFLMDQGRAKARQRGYGTFSDYMQELLRRDTTTAE